jgi:hypothetical protein
LSTIRFPRSLSFFLLCTAVLLLAPPESDAQRRGVRGGVRVVPGRGVVIRAYYAPLFYDPWFHPFGYRSGWYPPYYGYGPGYYYEPSASLRIQAEPRETEVFIDGYYAGTVDDFDGFFQRLQLEPGEHEVTLYLGGHRTARQSVYLQRGKTFRIRHTMEPLPAGSAPEPRPIAPPPPPAPSPPPQGGPITSQPAVRQTDAGTIAIRVQPARADILIDGEEWEGPADNEQLVVQVAPGAHRIEVRREGYRTYTSDVDVLVGQTSALNVSLTRQ